MKRVLLGLVLAAAVFAGAAEVDLSKPLPRLRLPDGRILQEVQFATFRAADVFVRHKYGSQVIRYEFLPDDIRAAAEQKRPGGPKWFPGETEANTLKVSGQVFVQTRGAGPYKFGDVDVYAFDAQHLRAWEETYSEVKLPKPLAKARTDGDGRFTLNVPKDTPFFLYCATRREVGQFTEENEWRVPGERFRSLTEAVLSNETVRRPTKRVTIEEQP